MQVHPEILAGQELPEELLGDKTIWLERFRSIVELENHLYRNGTRTIKIFHYESKDTQRKRFLQRIDDPKKNGKLSAGDVKERKLWKRYMHAYEACFRKTRTGIAP